VDIFNANVLGWGELFSRFLSFSSGGGFTRWVAVVYTKNVLWGRKRDKMSYGEEKGTKIVSGSRAEYVCYLALFIF